MSLFKGPSMTNRADKITSFQATTCDFGTPLPLAYGTCKLAPNLVNFQDFTAKETKQVQKSGKAKQTNINYRYNCYLELAIAEGIIEGIGKVWSGDTMYPSLATFNNTQDAVGAPLSLNNGSVNEPTNYMTTKHPDKACGYDQMAFAYGYTFLGENNASVPSLQFEVKGLLRSTGDGTDANPADIILDILTRLGMGNSVDIDSFDNYRRFCREADLLVSTPTDAFGSQKKASEVITELLILTNTYMYWSINKFKVVPKEDVSHGDWQPNRQIMYDLTSDDLSHTKNGNAMISFKRKDSSEVYNRFGLSFTNRINDYEQETVFFEDTEDIATTGIRASSVVNGKWFHTKERAIKAIEMLARLNRTEVVDYTFVLDHSFENLEPGDLVTLTDDSVGLDHQPVMVKSINIDTKGCPVVTAVRREPGEYQAAAFDVHEIDYNYINNNVMPSNTATPLFIIPPVDLVTNTSGMEMWIALHGTDSTWGGCNVMVSDNDGNYQIAGTQATSSDYGKLVTAMTEEATEVTVQFTNPNTVEMYVGSVADAEKANTLIWVNGECMSYSHAELIGENRYRLTGLIRGQYSTIREAHEVNENFAVLDSSIYVVPLSKHYEGRELYFKFPAFNQVQGNLQDFSDVIYYAVTANASDLPDCTNLMAFNKYREMGDDITRYDIEVSWTPAKFDGYQQAQVWYKTNGVQAINIGVIPEGVAGDEIGYEGKWTFAGMGYNSATIPQAIAGDTYRIAVCTQDIYGNVESPDMAPQTEILVGLKTEVPDTPSNLGVSIDDKFNIYWNEIRNADIKYYEIRTDKFVGVDSEHLLGRVTETSFSTNAITSRSGMIYIFGVSAYDKPSSPASIYYNFPAPSAPNYAIKTGFGDITLTVDRIPQNCTAIRYVIEGTSNVYDVTTRDKSYLLNVESDVYTVKANYIDIFGDGRVSEKSCTVQMELDPAWVHITENTIFDNNVIVSRMLQAKAVTAEKMSVESLSSVCATIGELKTADTGARTVIKDNLMEVYDDNDVLRVRIGVWQDQSVITQTAT